MKVVRIEPNNRCHITSMVYPVQLNGQFCDHETLMGLEHKGLKLGLYGMERETERLPVNKIAMKLLEKLKFGKHRDGTYPVKVRGPVLLYDDDGDMTTEKWNIIRNFIKSFSFDEDRKRRRLMERMKVMVEEEDWGTVNPCSAAEEKEEAEDTDGATASQRDILQDILSLRRRLGWTSANMGQPDC
tara:strand:+ start:240 stop:797 length:558 start_codon:yes stop_codon:yes gene_type:complete